ncbi:hypothetical protein PAECIP111802_07225 [Paenibacillus allorhizosphaerae]|uniref:Uncharacterized protein n=1 Tax=Paenibacillus allorhizosphaerae TaxID=2849866 RepID=A0ABM8VUH0_9BACL|nr:hypothetical protein PAECIP111802_07225 [Paenibacillus allorhizosphaerae]
MPRIEDYGKIVLRIGNDQRKNSTIYRKRGNGHALRVAHLYHA